jgi:hypothetical protein
MTSLDIPLDIFHERACTMADRVETGEIPLPEAADFLWSAAEYSGLLDRVGPDKIQAALASAFRIREVTCLTT